MTKGKMTPLPPTFQPGPYDVICAKGKDARNHEGNKFFRKLIQNALPIYKEASSKFEKSMIVSEVIDEIRSRTQIDGGFVKPDGNGGYMEVGDHLAREKVGQNLRDSLSDQYKSSTRAKRIRKAAADNRIASNVDDIVRGSAVVSNKMDRLSAGMERHNNNTPRSHANNSDIPEFFLNHLFTQIGRAHV